MTALVVLATTVTALCGQVTRTNLFSAVNLSIPEGDMNGVQDVRTNVSDIVQISSLRVRLSVAGQFNRDLYGYLRHSSGDTAQISVLLNRPGRSAANSYGYADRGLEVSFDDAGANDIHTYRTVTNPPTGTPLYGTWQPDARFVDPTLVTTTSPRSTFLSKFVGASAEGEGTLFLADADEGATNSLNSWGLEITGKIKPVTVPTEVGRRYVLEFSEALPASHWTALPAHEGNGTMMVLTDSTATNTQRFYRVRVE